MLRDVLRASSSLRWAEGLGACTQDCTRPLSLWATSQREVKSSEALPRRLKAVHLDVWQHVWQHVWLIRDPILTETDLEMEDAGPLGFPL